MNYILDNDKAFIRLDKDQDLFSSILDVANAENWSSAHISGIGALKNIELGYYDLSTQTYTKKLFNSSHELLSLDGNLCFLDGKRVLHLHGVFSGADFNCIGGHIFNAKVSVTCEVNLRVFNNSVNRKLNESVGLPCVIFDNPNSLQDIVK